MKRRDYDEASPRNSREGQDGDVGPPTLISFASVPIADCLVREVRQLSTFRQEEARKDVLGISPATDISQEMIALVWEHTNDLEDKAAWELAVDMNRDYAMSPKRAMSFLRSVGGKPKQAAKRLVRHFATKLDLFGPSKLVKDIEISIDFDEYDLEALESGGFQILREKDRAGRPILFGRYTLMKYREAKNMVGYAVEALQVRAHGTKMYLTRCLLSTSRYECCGICGTQWWKKKSTRSQEL